MGGVARFLSPEWMQQMETAAAASERLTAATAGVELSVRQVVSGAPGGDVAYTVRVSDGTVTIAPDRAPAGGDDMDIQVTQDYQTAAAISRGELSPATALAGGRLRIGGRIGLIVRYAEAWAGLGDAFAAVRDATEY